MPGQRQIARTVIAALTAGVLSASLSAVSLPAPQPDPEALRRDQEAIIHKAERLRELMETLLVRYRTEGRAQHVKLLEQGLEHLSKAGLVEDVASIRDSLRDRAMTEALRQQGEAIADLERLLGILLDRRSVENLEKEIETTTRLAAQADRLLQRQEELMEQTREQAAGEATEAEQAMLDRLAELARQQREESERNQRAAGIHAPFLEQALQQIKQLLDRQDQLEQSAQRQLEGEGALSREAREERFMLGELEQAQRELFDRRSAERALTRAEEAAETLKESLSGSDEDAAREALSRLLSRLEAAAARSEGAADEDLDQWRKQLSELGTQPEDRQELEQLASDIEAGVNELAEELGREAGAGMSALEQRLEEAAEQLKRDDPQAPNSSSAAVSEAQQALAKARELAEQGDQARAMAKMSEASRSLAEARKRHREENPDGEKIASDMAAESSQVASGLRRTPVIDGQQEAPERAAADALEAAEEALRKTSDQLGEREDSPSPGEVNDSVARSREQLESARDRLQEAMSGETGSREAEMQRAEERQRELQEQTEQLGEDLQRSQDSGISPEQREAAKSPLETARRLMQSAMRALEQGRQSTAAAQQSEAASSLDRAAEEMQAARPLSEQQQQALQELSELQAELEEDIIQLAREVEERNNEQARQALEQAAQAASQAQQSMQEGDQDQAEEQQQEARDRLEEAKEALEEERDRYQDLRLEELLFRIREELVAFLDKQRPLTKTTREAQEGLAQNSRMTRRVRRKLNELAREETELVSKAEYLRTALEEEGTLVFSHALKSNEDDLGEVARRLGGRYPDPGELTVMLQEDVEQRTVKLIDALKREQERRRNEQNSENGENQDANSQDQGQGQNGQPRLVPILAELEMLKQMEQDMLKRTEHMSAMLDARGGDGITELETTLMERMANRHNAVTNIFLQLKAQLDQALQPQQDENDPEAKDPGKDEDR